MEQKDKYIRFDWAIKRILCFYPSHFMSLTFS